MLRIVSLLIFMNIVSFDAMANDKDPWEEFNRAIFSFNEVLDDNVLKPTAKFYHTATPAVVDDSVTHFFQNLAELKTVINDLLQGKFKQAGLDTARFLINTSVGFLGFFDVATHFGLPRHQEDFAQTLAVWGVPSGPYLMLPFLGPSTVRSAGAYIPSFYVPSVSLASDDEATQWGLRVVSVVDFRAKLLKTEALLQGDRYSLLRDAYLQQRKYLVLDGQVEDTFGEEDLEELDF